MTAQRASATGAGWQFWIDVGGTFTDCVARSPDGALCTHKLLSTGVYTGLVGPESTATCIVDPRRCGDPAGFFDGWSLTIGDGPAARVAQFDPRAGALELEQPLASAPAAGERYVLSCGLEAPLVAIRYLLGLRLHEEIGDVEVRLGTTRGTNALLERKGAATALVTTAGFGDILRIGYQARPRLFDLHIRKPADLYQVVIEVRERIGADGAVLTPLDTDDAREKLAAARALGVEALAIALLNSYRSPAHEQQLAELAAEVGFRHVSSSAELSPLQRIVPRGETAVVDAYLTPVIRDYCARLRRGLPRASLRIMTSSGGLVRAESFVARDSILSGPAGGAVGAARVAEQAGFSRIINLDMGGTSTDVSRFAGEFERRYEMLLPDRESGGGVRLVAPLLAIETVAAGGGSICGFDGVKPIVGPHSAGADPGPACYGRGGPLCITDVNLFLGRIADTQFPIPLDRRAVEARLDELIEQIASASGRRYDRQELAEGLVAIANEHMAGAMRRVSILRGYDPRDHTLVSFGGAGGQHACALADALSIRTILLHPHAGVLSALGIGLAPITTFAACDVGEPLERFLSRQDSVFQALEAQALTALHRGGVPETAILVGQLRLDLRYRGQDAAISINTPADGAWRAAFERAHQRLYGFVLPEREIEVFAARVEMSTVPPGLPAATELGSAVVPADSAAIQSLCFAGRTWSAPLYLRAQLRPGHRFAGPAIVSEPTSTVFVAPGWEAEVWPRGEIVLTRAAGAARIAPNEPGAASAPCDPITLELFNSQFAAAAEQMGATLQRTALSTNVKERLDFSCAVFDADGGLVAHAPHIPVHLGAMSACVRCLMEDLAQAGPPRPGDVFVTNDPYRGGSHLPDVTVITPIFDAQGEQILFFAASRAHHAEIGGITPGSMPPHSRSLADEGVLLRALRLRTAAAGRVDAELRAALVAGPHPSRDVESNLVDIHAQMAANACGAGLLGEMVARHGLATVHAYMGHIQRAAETKMRAALARVPDGDYAFHDQLDDGTAIAVRITVLGDRAIVDFAGSGGVHPGNLNATPAIVASVVLYCFRCLIGAEVPLNSGVLAPLEIRVPPGLLNPPRHADPARCPAVVGGNVETSQRLADVIFGALRVAAASQGTMNNLAFGDATRGYYETIAGGAGAGPGFAGADAVHTHMTNTRLTDPEVLEARYPVRLRRFAIRRGSGGVGAFRGGDGVVREIEFLAPMELSLLTQRRTRPPFGLAGGGPGLCGANRLRRADGTVTELAWADHVSVRPGDVLTIETPGGGGFGSASG